MGHLATFSSLQLDSTYLYRYIQKMMPGTVIDFFFETNFVSKKWIRSKKVLPFTSTLQGRLPGSMPMEKKTQVDRFWRVRQF